MLTDERTAGRKDHYNLASVYKLAVAAKKQRLRLSKRIREVSLRAHCAVRSILHRLQADPPFTPHPPFPGSSHPPFTPSSHPRPPSSFYPHPRHATKRSKPKAKTFGYHYDFDTVASEWFTLYVWRGFHYSIRLRERKVNSAFRK